MVDPRPRVRLLFGGAALAAMALGTVACSSSGKALDPAATTSSSLAVTTTIVAGPPTSAAATDGSATDPAATSAPDDLAGHPSSVAAPVDGTALLAQALSVLDTSYHFTTTVTVDGNVALLADGDHVGNGTRLGVVRDNVTVQYIILPTGTWVMPDGGEWQQLDTPAATTDPIVALRQPTAVSVAGVQGTVATLMVTVPAVALGVSGDAPVPVTLAIDSGVLKTITYATTVDSKPASVVATIGAVVDGSPVVAPA